MTTPRSILAQPSFDFFTVAYIGFQAKNFRLDLKTGDLISNIYVTVV